MRRHSFRITFVAFSVVGLAFMVTQADTVPRYSARYEQNCNLCHYNPTGGGQRDLYATQFIVPSEMTLSSYDSEKTTLFDPQLSESVILGADLRTFFVEHNKGDFSLPPQQQFENFFTMQGNLYLHLQLDSRFALQFSQGWDSMSEYFGLGYVLPANGYLKLGQFVPAFGWKFDDHTRFVREYLDFFPPNNTESGIEAGLYPKHFALNAAVLNGSGGRLDDFGDENLEVVLRAQWTGRAGPVALALGGSYLNNRTDAERLQAGGPLWYFMVGPVTWMGELDVLDTKPAGSDDSVTQWVTSNELAVNATQGVNVLGIVDYVNNLERLVNDEESRTVTRLGVGVEIIPVPFLSLDGYFNYYVVGGGGEASNTENYAQLWLAAHLFN